MAVHERYKFQYLWDQALQVPHEGREWKVIIYEKPTPKVARITLNRPERRNAFNDNLFLEMLAAYHKAFDDANVRAIII
ncbi:MAG: enoyl-CoA hydratase-related protein, partial [Chloroflexota bacterium]